MRLGSWRVGGVFGVCVHGIAEDSEAEDGHGEGVAAIERVTLEQLGDGFVVILWSFSNQCTV